MDETSWKFLNAGKTTLAERGAEGVQCKFSVDEKVCATAIATVNAAGERLPLWVLAKGKTERSEHKYQEIEELEHAETLSFRKRLDT
jgi:hypothetical protein